MSASHVILNGRLVAVARASVNVYDRGFLYGDALFETLRGYGGVAFALALHLQRLRHSATALGIPVPDYDWPTLMCRLLARNGLGRGDAWIRLTLTRGPAEPGLLPPARPRPTTVIMARAIDPSLTIQQHRGVAVISLPFERDPFLADHKLVHYVPAVLGKIRAARARAYEGIYTGADGTLREGTTSSLFCVRGGRLYTPPARHILPGVTRHVLLDAAGAAGLSVAEEPLTISDLQHSDEAFLASTIVEVLPVVRADHARIGTGRPGPVTRRLQQLYRDTVQRACLR